MWLMDPLCDSPKVSVMWAGCIDLETHSVMTGNEGVTRNQAGTYICEASNAHGLIQEKTKEWEKL